MHPLTLQNTSLIFLRHFLKDQTRLHTEDTKGQATQGNSAWRTGMAGLLALLFVRDYAFFHPWKVKVFHFDTLIEVNCLFWGFNCSANQLQK